MSYRQPLSDVQLVRDRYKSIAMGMRQLFGNLNKSVDNIAKAENAKIAKSREILNKASRGAQDAYSEQKQKVLAKANEFIGGLGKEVEKTALRDP